MNRIFRRGKGTLVPDGTRVYPFLNPTDSSNDLPVDLFDGVSVALGEIAPRQASKLQVHPLVTVVMLAISGRVELKMKDAKAQAPYALVLGAEDGAVALPGTIFQLRNTADEICRVLYIVSPPYVFLAATDGSLVYDDAVVLDTDWDTLAGQQWQLPSIADLDRVRAARKKAISELARRKGSVNSGG